MAFGAAAVRQASSARKSRARPAVLRSAERTRRVCFRRYFSLDSDLHVTVDTNANDPGREPGGDHEYTYPVADDDEPVPSIVEAVADVTGTDVTDLDPLYEAIDTDALIALLDSMERGDFYRGPDGRPAPENGVTFEYEGCTVRVTPGRFTVEA